MQVIDIEEMAWAPKYGLKGMIDASVRVKVESGRDKADEKIVPLEFKTGKVSNGQASYGLCWKVCDKDSWIIWETLQRILFLMFFPPRLINVFFAVIHGTCSPSDFVHSPYVWEVCMPVLYPFSWNKGGDGVGI